MSIPDIDAWIKGQPDAIIVALTIMGEARGEDQQGRQMVASVIMTRVAVAAAHRAKYRSAYWWGETPREVCLKHGQFSCWLESDPNRVKMQGFLAHPLWAEVLETARAAIGGRLPDQAHGATHYLDPQAVKIKPNWATPANQVAAHLRHVFYRVPS
ncbi:MAG: cell wall hydrolase [Magnetospirillum sp.]|nr:cell wall hydrolase [Magnetospirillum sp.]